MRKRPPRSVNVCLALSLGVSVTLLPSGCVHRKIGQVLPPLTLSDTRTKLNLVVGQVFFEGANGEVFGGPNLQSAGLTWRSVSLGPISVSQHDMTLGEFLSAIGASSASCELSSQPFSSVSLAKEDGGWFQAEQDSVVGEEVSLLFEDVSSEIADPNSLGKLFIEGLGRSIGKAPPLDAHSSSAPVDMRGAFAVVQALYVGQVVVRFRVSEKADLLRTSEYFLGHPARSPNEIMKTLVKITSACGTQARARELSDPGLEVTVRLPARTPKGVRLVRAFGTKLVAVTPVETWILLYDGARLPSWSQQTPRVADGNRVWTVDTTTALDFLGRAQDQPPLYERSAFFKYCPANTCVAIITSEREFDAEGRPYNHAKEPPGCLVTGNNALPWKLFHREVMLRELVLFFGPAPLSGSGSEYNDYTSAMVRSVSRQGMFPGGKVGPTAEVWIYEYDCKGGVAELRPYPRRLTELGVAGHLRGWGLD
jgi:hypothetical protein